MEEKKLKEITNGQHSLFIMDREEEYRENQNGYQKIPKHTLYRLFIQDFSCYEQKEKNKINDIFNALYNAKDDSRLEIRISSPGGHIFELMRFSNIIDNFKNTTTILDNHGFSCGALIFLMGNKRIVYENSIIMFHYYSATLKGKGGEIKDEYEFNSDFYEKWFRKKLSPYFSKKEIDELIMGKDYWLDSKQMIKRGIATEVAKIF